MYWQFFSSKRQQTWHSSSAHDWVLSKGQPAESISQSPEPMVVCYLWSRLRQAILLTLLWSNSVINLDSLIKTTMQTSAAAVFAQSWPCIWCWRFRHAARALYFANHTAAIEYRYTSEAVIKGAIRTRENKWWGWWANECRMFAKLAARRWLMSTTQENTARYSYGKRKNWSRPLTHPDTREGGW